MKLDPKFGITYTGQKKCFAIQFSSRAQATEVFASVACVLLFPQEIYAGVSFLDSFSISATFLLANGKVVFQYLSEAKFRKGVIQDDLMNYRTISYEGELL